MIIFVVALKVYDIYRNINSTGMKYWMMAFFFLPVMLQAQSKKKKLKLQQQQQEQAFQQLIKNLQDHVVFLAHDSLEGRRTGTKGEQLAMQYIANYYQQLGIEPKGTTGYLQPFTINEGKIVQESSQLSIDDQALVLHTDYFPLAFSASKQLSSHASAALREKGEVWFLDVKDVLTENKNNPHFDMEDFLKKQANEVTQKGATALIIYNTSSITDNILFNKNDSTSVAIPVIYITQTAQKKFLKDKTATYHIAVNIGIESKIRTAHNVVAYINNNAENTVVIGAHYDHLGFGEDKNALDALHEVHNGADDNASGTAALLELARLLKSSASKKNNYVFINFSGEELGLFGSKYWVAHPTVDAKLNYMLNMDMVGRYDTSHKLTIGGYGTSPYWGSLFSTISTQQPLIIKFDSSGSGPSDHASFYRAGVPVLFFFTGSHADYHKTTDDADKINYTAQANIVQLLQQIIDSTNNQGKLVFTKTAEQQMGKTRFTVSLGVIPDYGYTGTGMRIEGVSAGKLAEKIGLQAGDILLQLGEYKFVDVNSYMQTLSKFKKGDTTVLKVKRADKELDFTITF